MEKRNVIVFDADLTIYELLIWKKIVFYVRDFSVSNESLLKEIKEFNLAMPSNLEATRILPILQKSDAICFKDNRKEEHFEIVSKDIDAYNRYCENHKEEDLEIYLRSFRINSYKYQDLMINKWNKSLNDIYAKLYSELAKEDTSDNIEKLANELFQYLATHVNQVSQFFLTYSQANKLEMSIDEFCNIKPIRHQFDFRGFPRMINTICSIDKSEKHKNSIKYFTLLYPTIILLRGYCAFSTFIALFLDAQNIKIFPSGFSKLIRFMLENFQDSSIYKIETPSSPPIHSDSISSRGAESYTTRLKIYVFDKEMNPILLRFDLPHKGENVLHVNVLNLTNNSSLDHYKLEANSPDIDKFFDPIIQQMVIETQNLFIFKNTNKEDDNNVLKNMKDLIYYDELCLLYLFRLSLEDKVEISNKELKLIKNFSFVPKLNSYEELLLDVYTKCKEDNVKRQC
jgi:hypothetical protein